MAQTLPRVAAGAPRETLRPQPPQGHLRRGRKALVLMLSGHPRREVIVPMQPRGFSERNVAATTKAWPEIS
eukprot:11163732-Lingulodinium_polyedra.AAC.1